MPLYKYYISLLPSDPSPEGGKLFFHEAGSQTAAIEELIQRGQLPLHWQSMWIHFLVWEDPKNGQRGFESLPLSKFSR